VIAFSINWKKPAPITRRELPLALGAIAISALSDFAVMDYVWKQHEAEVVRLTGYKNGIYVSPERLKAMRSKMNIAPATDSLEEEDFTIEED